MMVLFTSEDWQEKKRKEKKRKNLVEKCGIIDYETIPTIVSVNQT